MAVDKRTSSFFAKDNFQPLLRSRATEPSPATQSTNSLPPEAVVKIKALEARLYLKVTERTQGKNTLLQNLVTKVSRMAGNTQ